MILAWWRCSVTMISAPLPFYLYQQIGSYRSRDGAVTALILLLLCFLLFTVIEKTTGAKC